MCVCFSTPYIMLPFLSRILHSFFIACSEDSWRLFTLVRWSRLLSTESDLWSFQLSILCTDWQWLPGVPGRGISQPYLKMMEVELESFCMEGRGTTTELWPFSTASHSTPVKPEWTNHVGGPRTCRKSHSSISLTSLFRCSSHDAAHVNWSLLNASFIPNETATGLLIGPLEHHQRTHCSFRCCSPRLQMGCWQ